MEWERLRHFQPFDELSEGNLKTVASVAIERTVPEGLNLAYEGDYAFEFFIIVEGTAIVRREGHLVRELGPGDFFGEVGILGRGYRTADVRATSSMQLIMFRKRDLDRIQGAMPDVARRLRQVAKERVARDLQQSGDS